MMFTIALVNMPFAALQRPSIALTQLKAILDQRFGADVATSVHYLNQDFGRDFGVGPYTHVVNSIDAHNGGFGDWFFRQVAFPDLPDNTDEYFSRYYIQPTREHEQMRAFVATERPKLASYLDGLIDAHHLDTANIVGFTTMFAQNVASMALARRIKLRNPQAIIVFGGANCEAPMGRELATHVDVVDFAFSGPALRTFPDFVDKLRAGDIDGCHRIDGVFSKKNRPRAAKGATLQLGGLASSLPEVGPVGAELDVDTTIALDYDEFMATLDRNFQDPPMQAALTFETSRGCWWGERAHCTFCGLNSDSMGYRAMGSERAVALIQSLFKYAARTSRLECVDNIMPKNYLREVFPNLHTPENLTIFYEVKADLSDADLAVLAEARVHSLQPGIEALATSTLKLMKKGTSGSGNVRFLKDCVRHGIYPEWNLLVGFPGEDERVYEAYERDLPLLTHLPPPSGVYPIRFDRFSPYHTKAAEFGLDLHPYDFYSLVYPFPERSLQNLAYYFIDRNFSASYITTTAKWIGRLRAQIDPWKARWHGSSQGADTPRLFLKEDASGTHVFDSRRGDALEYPLTPAQRKILERLDTGASADQIASACALPIDTVVAELAWFSERGLLFREGDRFVSLVFRTQDTMIGRQPIPAALPAAPPELVARARSARRVPRSAAAIGSTD